MEGETSVIESRVHRSNYKQRKLRFFFIRKFFSRALLSERLEQATWPKSSCTWDFPLCILVFYGELIPSSFVNQISPPSQISSQPLLSPPPPPPTSNGLEISKLPGGSIEDLRYSRKMRQQILDLKLVGARDDAFIMSSVKMVNCSKTPLHHNQNFFLKSYFWSLSLCLTIFCLYWYNNIVG